MPTMIAAWLHEYGKPMTLDRIEVPEPRPTDVLVEVKACGVVPNLTRVVSNFFGTLTPDNKMMPPLPASCSNASKNARLSRSKWISLWAYTSRYSA